MKNIKAKIETVLSYVYGIGIACALAVGTLSVIGYVIAIIVGGNVAENICTFVYKQIYPILIYASSVIVLIGLLKMYISGQHSLTASKKKYTEKKDN